MLASERTRVCFQVCHSPVLKVLAAALVWITQFHSHRIYMAGVRCAEAFKSPGLTHRSSHNTS